MRRRREVRPHARSHQSTTGRMEILLGCVPRRLRRRRRSNRLIRLAASAECESGNLDSQSFLKQCLEKALFLDRLFRMDRGTIRGHSSPRCSLTKSEAKPARSGPDRTIFANRCFGSAERLDGRPWFGSAFNASSPPCFQGRFRRFTLDTSTPTSFATSVRHFRSVRRSAARRRRASSYAALPKGLIAIETHAGGPTVHSICRGQ